MHWGIAEVVLAVAGGLLVLAGVWVLLFLRPKRVEPLHLADRPPPPSRLSEPTRLVLALVLLVSGYHAAVWAFPRRFVGVQFDRSLWYVWISIGLAAVVVSLLLDSYERDRFKASGPETTPPERPSAPTDAPR